MKKIYFSFLFLMIIVLSGCASSEPSRAKIFDIPADDISTALNLADVKGGVSISGEIDKNQGYWDVLVDADLESSLFYHTVDIDSYLNDKLKSISVTPLYFHKSLSLEDLNQFCTIINGAEALAKKNVNVAFKEDAYSKLLLKTENSSNEAVLGSTSISVNVNIPNDFKVVDGDCAKLVVVYLPIYGIYNDGKEDYTNVHVMIPVYYAVTYETKVADYTSGIKNYQLTFEKYYTSSGAEQLILPSKTE